MVTQRKITVAVCVPSGDEVRTDFLMSLWMMQRYNHEHCPNIDLRLLNIRDSILTRSRQTLVEKALQIEADWILFLDSDMVFPPGLVHRLVAHNLDIVGVNCPQRRSLQTRSTAWHWCEDMTSESNRQVDLLENSGALEEVGYLGTGVLLIRATVFQALPKPWFLFEYLAKGDYWVSEDYYFCAKARKAGFPAYLDHYFDYRVGHIGQHIYNQHGAIEREEFMALAAQSPR